MTLIIRPAVVADAIRERTDVPDAIHTTEEFSSLCPGTAVVMSKSLR